MIVSSSSARLGVGGEQPPTFQVRTRTLNGSPNFSLNFFCGIFSFAKFKIPGLYFHNHSKSEIFLQTNSVFAAFAISEATRIKSQNEGDRFPKFHSVSSNFSEIYPETLPLEISRFLVIGTTK